ncbi:MAG: aldo/keto reductase [Clostridiales bacterium GWC2_40_7]|nr:MAG: aldo/keto reductase [Clostridiales bacterium GWC2_40_7]
MKKLKLGNSGIEVSRLCFGALIIGPLQSSLSVEEGAEVILEALKLGVNFIDSAELYGTYPHIRKAISLFGDKPVIASKSYAYSKDGAKASLELVRKGLNIDVVDIFMLHEQESRLTLRGHRDALEYYLGEKQKGRIKAVGVSTHNIEVVEACSEMPEIDIIHPIINRTGIGIGDGSIESMLSAVRKAYDKGKGIYSMKPLGGGNLLSTFPESMEFALSQPFVHSIAVGMQSVEEVIMNVNLFEGKDIPQEILSSIKRKGKKLHIDYWCSACGKCVSRCGQNALSVIDGKARVDMEKCLLCGYCGSACPQFAIKIC